VNIDDTVFGKVKDLNTRRNRYRTLLAATFKNESLLWRSEEEYAAILSGLINDGD
jgi:hypothetical protein